MTKKIWCLFSMANEHNQPCNNLVMWFEHKPSIEKLLEVLLPSIEKLGKKHSNEQIVNVVNVYQGDDVDFGGVSYRLEEVESDKQLKEE